MFLPCLPASSCYPCYIVLAMSMHELLYYIIFIACMFLINQFLLVQLTICKLLIISLVSLDIY